MRRVKVGDVLELQRRQVDVDPEVEYREIGVRSFGKGLFHKAPVTGIELGNKRVFEIHPGDLVFSNVFAWEGAVGLASARDDGRIGSHRFMTYTARDDEEVDVSYLRFYFTSERGIELLGIASPGSAGRNRTLAQERFESIEIVLPDIAEQHRLAAHLNHIRDSVTEFDRRRSLTRPRSNALAASIAAQPQLGEAERRDEGWLLLPLGEVMEPATDSVEVAMDGSYPNLGIYSFGRGVFEKPPINGLATSAKKLNRVREGEFIYSRLFAFEGAYAYVPEEFDGYFVSNEFPSFAVDSSTTSARFVAAALRSPGQWTELAGSSKGLGLRRQRIQVEALLAHELWFPPLAEQQRIVTGLERLERLSSLLEKSDVLVSAVTPSALNRAFAALA